MGVHWECKDVPYRKILQEGEHPSLPSDSAAWEDLASPRSQTAGRKHPENHPYLGTFLVFTTCRIWKSAANRVAFIFQCPRAGCNSTCQWEGKLFCCVLLCIAQSDSVCLERGRGKGRAVVCPELQEPGLTPCKPFLSSFADILTRNTAYYFFPRGIYYFHRDPWYYASYFIAWTQSPNMQPSTYEIWFNSYNARDSGQHLSYCIFKIKIRGTCPKQQSVT